MSEQVYCPCGCGEYRDECTPKTEVRADDPQQRTHTFCTVHGALWPCRSGERPAGDTKAQAAYHDGEES